LHPRASRRRLDRIMNDPSSSFNRLYGIMRTLRSPGGCPWDREQDPRSIRGNLVEEAYECVDAVSSGDLEHIKEEIGDVYLVITFMAYMFEQQGDFSVSDVLEGVSNKLTRRHPHVFGSGSTADTAEKVIDQWRDIKVTVEGRKPKDSVVDQVSSALPPLDRAFKMQKKAARLGFDWKEKADVWGKVREELEELRQADNAGDPDRMEDEMGDLLFAVVNLSRFMSIDPSASLSRAIGKFRRRFREMEERMKEMGLGPAPEHFDLMDRLWNEVKAGEKTAAP